MAEDFRCLKCGQRHYPGTECLEPWAIFRAPDTKEWAYCWECQHYHDPRLHKMESQDELKGPCVVSMVLTETLSGIRADFTGLVLRGETVAAQAHFNRVIDWWVKRQLPDFRLAARANSQSRAMVFDSQNFLHTSAETFMATIHMASTK